MLFSTTGHLLSPLTHTFSAGHVALAFADAWFWQCRGRRLVAEVVWDVANAWFWQVVKRDVQKAHIVLRGLAGADLLLVSGVIGASAEGAQETLHTREGLPLHFSIDYLHLNNCFSVVVSFRGIHEALGMIVAHSFLSEVIITHFVHLLIGKIITLVLLSVVCFGDGVTLILLVVEVRGRFVAFFLSRLVFVDFVLKIFMLAFHPGAIAIGDSGRTNL
jgi:hypothetical protein